jgi:hypothetical protein
MNRFTLSAFAVLTVFAAALPASAGDLQGDAYPCEELWVMRNQIYKDNGYCFTSQRAITYFGNGGCSVSNQSALSLSKSEGRLLRDIKLSERRQGC